MYPSVLYIKPFEIFCNRTSSHSNERCPQLKYTELYVCPAIEKRVPSVPGNQITLSRSYSTHTCIINICNLSLNSIPEW
jgi:hypothetical protein